MPVYVYALNAVLATAIVGVIVGLLMWSVTTQHRQVGCENVRLRLSRRRISLQLRQLGRDEAQRPAEEVVLN